MIHIKLEKQQRNVYKDYLLIGSVRSFCCGIDFRIDDKPNALFSIMPKTKYEDEKLRESIETILGLEIPERNFHWNFSHKLLTDEKKLKEYQNNLLKPVGNG